MIFKNWIEDLFKSKLFGNWFGFGLAVVILLITLYFSYSFAESLQRQEQAKMESFRLAFEQMQKEDISQETRDVLLQITEKSEDIPMIMVDEKDQILADKNLKNPIRDSLKLVKEMKSANGPITLNLPWGKEFIYYKNSSLSIKLKYYPIVLVSIIIIFAIASLLYFRTLKNSEQSYLWAGMAKETAHQIGTPLSSLMGWFELMKIGIMDEDTLTEVDKDIQRLNNIANRFSKIGSEPELERTGLVSVVKHNYDYLKFRISNKVEFSFEAPNNEVYANANALLIGWVIENLTKNAVDALQNKGKINIKLEELNQNIKIIIQDNGPGIPVRYHKRIFDPGYTTKKRGWGLGLSLAKRIIQEYHGGKIWVEQSDKEQGTKFSILIPKAS